MMPIVNHSTDKTPKKRRIKDPRHSTHDLRQFGSDCAQAQVAKNLRIVLQDSSFGRERIRGTENRAC